MADWVVWVVVCDEEGVVVAAVAVEAETAAAAAAGMTRLVELEATMVVAAAGAGKVEPPKMMAASVSVGNNNAGKNMLGASTVKRLPGPELFVFIAATES